MALSPQALKSWMAGQSTEAKPASKALSLADDGDPEPGADDAPAERNALWAGEAGGPEAVTPETAQELMGWLEQNEPELNEALVGLADAVSSGDPRMVEQATGALAAAPQILTPEYPPFDPAQREALVPALTSAFSTSASPEAGSPEWSVAVAQALVQARAPQAAAPEDEEDPAGKPGAPPKPGGPPKPKGFQNPGAKPPPAGAPKAKPPLLDRLK